MLEISIIFGIWKVFISIFFQKLVDLLAQHVFVLHHKPNIVLLLSLAIALFLSIMNNFQVLILFFYYFSYHFNWLIYILLVHLHLLFMSYYLLNQVFILSIYDKLITLLSSLANLIPVLIK